MSIQFFMVVGFWYPNQHFKVSEQFQLMESLISIPEIITTMVIGLRTFIYDLTHEHVLIAMEHTTFLTIKVVFQICSYFASLEPVPVSTIWPKFKSPPLSPTTMALQSPGRIFPVLSSESTNPLGMYIEFSVSLK